MNNLVIFTLVQQTGRYLHQRKLPRILLKLEHAKAFDLVSWLFLLKVMQHQGFWPIWCHLISALLYTSFTRVLLNGMPREELQHQTGLSPLCCLLFCPKFYHSKRKWCWSPATTCPRPLWHWVSLYADDVILFLRLVASDIDLILEILRVFGVASGLKTNIQMSSVTPIQSSEENINLVQQLMPCEIKEFPLQISQCSPLLRPCSFNPPPKGIGVDWRGFWLVGDLIPLKPCHSPSKATPTEQGLKEISQGTSGALHWPYCRSYAGMEGWPHESGILDWSKWNMPWPPRGLSYYFPWSTPVHHQRYLQN